MAFRIGVGKTIGGVRFGVSKSIGGPGRGRKAEPLGCGGLLVGLVGGVLGLVALCAGGGFLLSKLDTPPAASGQAAVAIQPAAMVADPPASPVADAATPPEAEPVTAVPELRTWSSAAGQFSVEAEFAGYSGGTVKLRKPDGTTLRVELSKLSAADQEWIEARRRQAGGRRIDGAAD